jgi:hypothetical protein
MRAFSLHNPGFVASLGGGGSPAPGGQRGAYGQYSGSESFAPPAIAGARSLTLWLRVTGGLVDPSGNPFLLDGSMEGSRSYYFRDAFGSQMGGTLECRMNGVPVTGGYAQLVANTWAKIYFEVPALDLGPVLFNRISQNQFYAFFPADFAAIMVHSRAFTDAEKADAATDFPTDSVLARYDGTRSGAQLLDSSGHGHHATIV